MDRGDILEIKEGFLVEGVDFPVKDSQLLEGLEVLWTATGCKEKEVEGKNYYEERC